MSYKTLDLSKIKEEYNRFKITSNVDISILANNHKSIRDFFVTNYYVLKNEYGVGYKLDLELGLLFYEFMNKQQDFIESPKYKSNYDFWRYVAVVDIPDIIADRFGIDKIDHFYKKASRVYPYTLYWYIHMSWQGNVDETKKILENNNTDVILQIVERPSRIGINIDLYRMIMKGLYISMIGNGQDIKFDTRNFFRELLTINTSKLTVFRPELYPGGIENYVSMLLKGVKENERN